MTPRLALLGTGLATRIHSNALKAVAPGVERGRARVLVGYRWQLQATEDLEH